MQNLSKAIQESGITKKDIAAATGITYMQLRRYETGENEATESKIIALARLLHVSADYLLGLNEENER